MPELDMLTSEVLRDLYLEQLLPEKVIAERYGTYQVKVNRLRKKWGIPTLGKTKRIEQSLPPLTPEQEQILTGSLLGDGWMAATSATSARFSEGHAENQAFYLEWKAEKLTPYTSSSRDGEKVDGGKIFKSRSFTTHSCPQLRRFYDLFYPAPHRIRVFPKDLPERMTSLVLAVWYMDDGSLAKGNEPRIHFGIDQVSLFRGLKALRALGLKPKVYGEGSEKAIHFPKQRHIFRELVEPHIPECMSYKIPGETPRQKGDRNARRLTPEEAARLYEGGLSTEAIADLFKVGSSTVTRRLHKAGVQKRRSGPRSSVYTPEAAAALVECLGDDVDEIVRVLKNTSFPSADPLDSEGALSIFQKVRAAEMGVEDGQIVPLRRVGIALCNPFFPNRYKACSYSRKSAFESWHLESELRRAVRFQLKVGDPVVPHRVLRAVSMNCRTPTIFRPTVAKFIYERYLPDGGRAWDPCSGYGGRLVGALAAGVSYVGTDVDPETVKGNRELADVLGGDAEVHCCPAEGFDPPEVGLVFTSPPYFQRELYAEGEQSWKYSEFDSWVEGFLRPVVERGVGALLPGGHFVLNVADVRIGRKKIPLVERTGEVLSRADLVEVERLRMPLSVLNRENPYEPVLVFRKG